VTTKDYDEFAERLLDDAEDPEGDGSPREHRAEDQPARQRRRLCRATRSTWPDAAPTRWSARRRSVRRREGRACCSRSTRRLRASIAGEYGSLRRCASVRSRAPARGMPYARLCLACKEGRAERTGVSVSRLVRSSVPVAGAVVGLDFGPTMGTRDARISRAGRGDRRVRALHLHAELRRRVRIGAGLPFPYYVFSLRRRGDSLSVRATQRAALSRQLALASDPGRRDREPDRPQSRRAKSSTSSRSATAAGTGRCSRRRLGGHDRSGVVRALVAAPPPRLRRGRANP
jgi:hypothetical protein